MAVAMTAVQVLTCGFASHNGTGKAGKASAPREFLGPFLRRVPLAGGEFGVHSSFQRAALRACG